MATIYPTKKYNRPTPPPTIDLHGLDIIAAPIQIHIHRIYHRPEIPFEELVEQLKDSLAQALELYPPVAGTVRTNEEGKPYIALDNLGTKFLVDTRDTPFDADDENLSPRLEVLLHPPADVFAVKVTQFSCGTIAVASSLHHQVADLPGCVDLLQLWAQIARGETIDFTKIPNAFSHTPQHFFSSVTPTATITTPPPGYEVLSTPPTSPPSFSLGDIARWKFTRSYLQQLHQDFSPPQSSNQWISSGDALAALFWGIITRARARSNPTRPTPGSFGGSGPNSPFQTLAMAADGRSRAPRGDMLNGQYFGNFNQLFSATVSRSDLLSTDIDASARVALSIRNSLIRQLTPEAIAHKTAFMNAPENSQAPNRINWKADVVMTNWCKFDLLGPKLDFGWGRPFVTTAGGGEYPSGYVRFMSDMSSGDIYVMATVEKEVADALKADPVLNKYAIEVTVKNSTIS